ncbi:MAG: S41 family peptidase [Pyrinomonadaceae bacterium]
MKRWLVLIALGFVMITTVVGGLARRGLGKSTGPSGSQVSLDEVVTDYEEALGLVTENYAGEINFEKATQTSIQGMLYVLDPHSSFFTAAEFAKLREDQSSRFYGIGVSILQHRDGVYVEAVVRNTPAERAGLRFGDRIVEVDGKDSRDWSSSEVSRNVRGPFGEMVTVKVERAGNAEPISFKIQRDAVPLPSIRNYFLIKPGVGYIGLTGGFQQTTDEELGAAITALKAQGMTQLVLDLRGNPGGILEQAIKVSSRFIAHGKVITSVRGRTEYSEPEIYHSIGKATEDFPLVVLINHNSASASEIVAGAIQDHGRGYIVGQTSFGKGLVQHIFYLMGGTGLTLTTARYYTPFGRSLQRDYSNGSIYEYYVQHGESDGSPPPATPTPTPTPSGPAITAAGGRVLYGGGGVSPDLEVKPESATTERGRIADAAFYFTRQLVAGQIAGINEYRIGKTTYGHDLRDSDYVVSDELINAFKAFAAHDPKLGLTAENIDAALVFSKVRIRSELITAAFGIEAGNRVLLETDNQVLRGIESFPAAKQLSDLVKSGPQVM